ncbi:hypothetical protein M405DRAFT_644202 [Rhizopogon salebrosus TDB-379]|nr:hypothetical protein M405DRAFT_644202 [Rhizopogon salebrosus TDB-379]
MEQVSICPCACAWTVGRISSFPHCTRLRDEFITTKFFFFGGGGGGCRVLSFCGNIRAVSATILLDLSLSLDDFFWFMILQTTSSVQTSMHNIGIPRT